MNSHNPVLSSKIAFEVDEVLKSIVNSKKNIARSTGLINYTSYSELKRL